MTHVQLTEAGRNALHSGAQTARTAPQHARHATGFDRDGTLRKVLPIRRLRPAGDVADRTEERMAMIGSRALQRGSMFACLSLALPMSAPAQDAIVAWGVQLSAFRFHGTAMLRSGSYDAFAAGCPGSAGITHLHANSLARLGGMLRVDLLPLPQSAAILLAGLSNVASGPTPLPFDLSPSGLTNCLLRVSPDASVFVAGTGNAATFTLAVPAVPSLSGFTLHQQAVVLDMAAGNAAGLVMSDAATAVVGS